MAYIGIDLGTTYSAVATIDSSGRPIILHNSDGENITPSCVTETEEGTFEVGEYARRTWGVTSDKAAARFKKSMGTDKLFRINTKELSSTELSSLVIKKLVQDAEKEVKNIAGAVVTVPANFANDARDSTMSAAKNAGLNVKYIINEPTAAALYYAFKNGDDLNGCYAVFDLGGGTFDVSIIRVNGQDVEVLASNGVAKLGGDDFDRAMQNLVKAKYQEVTGSELDEEDFTINDAEEEKKSLSKRDEVTVRVNRKLIKVSKSEFEESISALILQTEMLSESTLDEANLSADDIQSVFLAGGSTRIPAVKQSVIRVFGQEPIISGNVDEVVALGAALYAAYKGDRTNLTATQKIAIDKIQVSETSGKCFGTLTLTMDEHRDQYQVANSVLIHKGDKIPSSVTKSFYTSHAGQEYINCEITESTSAESDPKFVNVIWKGDLALPTGRPEGQEIQITYAYDENQMMQCEFKDVESGRTTNIELSLNIDQDAESEIEKYMVF